MVIQSRDEGHPKKADKRGGATVWARPDERNFPQCLFIFDRELGSLIPFSRAVPFILAAFYE